MNKTIILIGLLLCLPLSQGAETRSYVLVDMRLFEGLRQDLGAGEFQSRGFELDPERAADLETETASLADLFQLKRVICRSNLELWLPDLVRVPQTMQITLHARLLTLAFEPMTGQADRFRLTVSVEPPVESKREVLLETVVILPQEKRAVLGFKDRENRFYFISMGRGKNVAQGYDRLIEGKAVRNPRLLLHVIPDYPQEAMKQGLEGMVVVEGTTDAKGRVILAEILTGPKDLSPAAQSAVKQWVYRPFNVDGVDEPCRFLVAVHFFLKKDGGVEPAPEQFYQRFDQFWQTHEKSPWPDSRVKGPVSQGINQRLVEIVTVEGHRQG